MRGGGCALTVYLLKRRACRAQVTPHTGAVALVVLRSIMLCTRAGRGRPHVVFGVTSDPRARQRKRNVRSVD